MDIFFRDQENREIPFSRRTTLHQIWDYLEEQYVRSPDQQPSPQSNGNTKENPL